MKAHSFLFRTRWFRVYFKGNYSWLEIDFGKSGIHEFVIFLFNKDCMFKARVYNI